MDQPTYFDGSGGWNPNQPTLTFNGLRIDASIASVLLQGQGHQAIIAPAEEYKTIIRDGRPQLARWQVYADGYQGYVPVGARYLGKGQIGSGGAIFKGAGGVTLRASSGKKGDTDLARLNGATGEAELGRSLDFGLQQGGGQRNPPQVAGTKDKDAINDFNNSFNEAVARLNNPDCAKLFGGLNAAQTALYGAKYGYTDLGTPKYDPDTGKVKVTGAATNNAVNPPSVYINKYGPFRNTTLNVITPGGVKSPTVDYGTGLRGAHFGALILLHELGHLTKVFQPDAGNEQLNNSYTDQVLKACFKEVKKK